MVCGHYGASCGTSVCGASAGFAAAAGGRTGVVAAALLPVGLLAGHARGGPEVHPADGLAAAGAMGAPVMIPWEGPAIPGIGIPGGTLADTPGPT